MSLKKTRAGELLVVTAMAIVFAWPSRFPTSAITVDRIPGYVDHGQSANQASSSKPANSWKTMVPLRSTRSDVERLFGKPHAMLGTNPLYRFKEENVMFTYARGNCELNDAGWNVPVDTVLEIEIIPQTEMSLGKAGFDLSKYRRTETQHPPAITYTNVEEGVTIVTRMSTAPEDIMSIQLKPSVRELEFACPGKPAKLVQ